MKKEEGITLVALILVMFLLIVLAGISISLVVTSDQEQANNTVTPNPTYYIEENILEENTAEENIVEETNENTTVIEDNTVIEEINNIVEENVVVE